MLVTSDQFAGGDKAAFMQALADRLTVEAMARHGWKGAAIADVDWQDLPGPGALVQAPIATVAIVPGPGRITVAELRAAFAGKQAAARSRPARQEEMFA